MAFERAKLMLTESDPTPIEISGPPIEVPEGVPFARPVSFESGSPPSYRSAFFLDDISRKAAVCDVIILILFVLCLEGLAAVAMGLSVPVEGPESPELRQKFLIPALGLRVLVCLTAIVVVLRARGQGLDAVGLQRVRLRSNLLLGFPTLGAAGVSILAAMSLVLVAFPSVQKRMVENARALSDLVPMMSTMGYLALMGLVGFYEELVFRGFILARLRRATGSWVVAVAISSVLFTLPHAADQEWIALIPVAILAITFSLVTIWRRSIVPAIVAHALWNFGVVIYLRHILAGALS